METGLLSKDVDKAMAEIEEIKKGVGDLAIRLSANPCKTQEQYDQGIIQIKESNLILKKFELAKQQARTPYKLVVDKIDGAVKSICAPIESAIQELKGRGNSFIRSENERKQKELDRLAAEKAKNDQKLETADTRKEQDKAIKKDAQIQERVETVKAHNVGGNARRRTFRVVDESLVPREYLVVDESKIRKNMGKVDQPFPTIPGVVFEDVQEMRG